MKVPSIETRLNHMIEKIIVMGKKPITIQLCDEDYLELQEFLNGDFKPHYEIDGNYIFYKTQPDLYRIDQYKGIKVYSSSRTRIEFI